MSDTELDLPDRIFIDLLARQAKGIKTYGTKLHEAGLSSAVVCRHGYEEALDLSIYLKQLHDLLHANRHLLRTAERAEAWLEAEGYEREDSTGWWLHTRQNARVLRPVEALRLFERHQSGEGLTDQF